MKAAKTISSSEDLSVQRIDKQQADLAKTPIRDDGIATWHPIQILPNLGLLRLYRSSQ
jgi:hypothetical protein